MESEGSVEDHKLENLAACSVSRDQRVPSPLARDAIFGKEDAAFRIDLPNGTYRITNIFHTAEAATHEVYMLANGKPIIKNLLYHLTAKRLKRQPQLKWITAILSW